MAIALVVLASAGVAATASCRGGDGGTVGGAVRAAGPRSVTHFHGTEVAVSFSQLRDTEAALEQARAATERYRDVSVARAEGYRQEGPSLRGAGAHFVNPAVLAEGGFDIRRPPILLYERHADWSFELVGVGWFVPNDGRDVPPPYLAPLAAWHYHDYAEQGICIDAVGTTNLDTAPCQAVGGRHWARSPWMLHAWIYRDSPEGVFSFTNSAVDGFDVIGVDDAS